MHHDYEDIRSRIAEPPTWFDEHSVPRWGEFSPQDVADIYAKEAALVRIACQACGHTFDRAVSKGILSMLELGRLSAGGDVSSYKLRDSLVEGGSLGFGDPPNIGCCPAGPTMTADELRVLQYWTYEGFTWTRDPTYEVRLCDSQEL